jgi:PAS domain S-box-containing protein
LKESLYRITPIIQRALKEASERQQREVAERQRSFREQQLQRIMDLSLDVICTLDQEGIFVTVSAAAKAVWGYRPEELVGKRGIDLVHEADKERTIQAIADLRTGKDKDLVNFENRYIRKDGAMATLLWSVHWNPKENLFYAIARDAHDIKQAEEKIKNNEKRFRPFYKIAPMAIVC